MRGDYIDIYAEGYEQLAESAAVFDAKEKGAAVVLTTIADSPSSA